MESFRMVLEKCNLIDIGWIGSLYTWCNNHYDETFTKERLDRVVANLTWSEFYSNVKVDILAASTSNCKPLLLYSS